MSMTKGTPLSSQIIWLEERVKELSLYLDERAVDVFKSTWKQED
jgi:hypothetical protein